MKYNGSFLVPLDADEFIVSFNKTKLGTNTGLVIDRRLILNEIRTVPVDGRKYKFSGSHPVKHNISTCDLALSGNTSQHLEDRRVLAGGFSKASQYRPKMSKTFFYSEGFISTDQGYHLGRVENDKYVAELKVKNHTHTYFKLPTVSLLHYSASSYAHSKAKYLRAADAYGFNRTAECIHLNRFLSY